MDTITGQTLISWGVKPGAHFKEAIATANRMQETSTKTEVHMLTLSNWAFKIVNIGKPLVRTLTFHKRKNERIGRVQAEQKAKRDAQVRKGSRQRELEASDWERIYSR